MGNECWPGYDGSHSIKVSKREVIGTGHVEVGGLPTKTRLCEREDQSSIIITCVLFSPLKKGTFTFPY